MRMALSFLAVMTIVCSFGCAAKPRTFLTPATTIVVPSGESDADTQSAAELLQKWLRKATDRKEGFEIVSQDALALPVTRMIIALGDTEWVPPSSLAGVGSGGYRIRRIGNVVTIAGKTPRGTFQGVVAFLDQVCGVRFYMPGDLFTTLPTDRRVSVDDVDCTANPFVTACLLSGVAEQSSADAVWVRCAGGLSLTQGMYDHNLNNIFPSEVYAERYPEIYPILDAERRYIPADASDSNWQPCFSSPTLVEAAVEAAAAYFRAHPQEEYLSFGIADSDRFCECDQCKAIVAAYESDDAQNGRARAHSILYWRFMNAVAGRLERVVPGKRIIGLGYGQSAMPPPFELHSNIVVLTNYRLAQGVESGTTVPRDTWLDLGAAYGNRDEYLGGGFFLSRSYSDRWAHFLRRVRSQRDEAYLHIDGTPNWGLDGPKLYILSRLCWNPREDVDELLEQFCADMFGSAAEPMVEYFQTSEALWARLEKENPGCVPYLWGTQFTTRSRSMALVRKARHYLDDAANLARTSLEEQRIMFFSKSFRLTECLLEIGQTDRPSDALLGQTEAWMTILLSEENPAPLNKHALQDALDVMFGGK